MKGNQYFRDIAQRTYTMDDGSSIIAQIFYDKGEKSEHKFHGRGFYVSLIPATKKGRKGKVMAVIPNAGETQRIMTVGRFTKKGVEQALALYTKLEDVMVRRVAKSMGTFPVCDVVKGEVA